MLALPRCSASTCVGRVRVRFRARVRVRVRVRVTVTVRGRASTCVGRQGVGRQARRHAWLQPPAHQVAA